MQGARVDEIIIDPAFEGPPGSANGGYVCGLLSLRIPGDAEVTLRRPPPLGGLLRVEAGDGGLVLRNGPDLIAEARATRIDPPAVQPPTYQEAVGAGKAFAGFAGHPFPRCVVCGPERADTNALRVFPGPLPDRSLVAAVWRPRGGAVAEELVWAALDCPGGWAVCQFGKAAGTTVLGRMAARLEGPVAAGDELIAAGWLEGVEGRKFTAGSAIYSRTGTRLGFSRQTWITVGPTEVQR